MDVQGYVNEIRALYASGQTTEHSFRPALAKLFASIDPDLTVINEPKHITDVGAPDFVFQRGDVAIGWCEAKDIGKDVRKFAANDYSKGQKERYRKGLPNLIYTNGLDFEFIREGEVMDFITIADLIPTMPARADNSPLLEHRLRDFAAVTPLSITSSKRLAEMMAGKAAIIKDIMGRALVADFKAQEQGATPTDLIGQYEAFKENLIHDITVDEFADIYAETIAYGLFAARLHDETPATFTRGEALDLLPKTNPFLRELFIYIAGPNLDERLRRIVDELCNVFCATNMEQVLRHFGKVTARQEPFLHFYGQQPFHSRLDGDLLTFGGVQLRHGPGERGGEGVLHFHRLQHDQPLAFFDSVPFGHVHGDYRAGHRRADRAVSRAAFCAPRRSRGEPESGTSLENDDFAIDSFDRQVRIEI